MSKGKLICFEGLDGAGKATQLEILRFYIDKVLKLPVWSQTFPTQTYWHSNYYGAIQAYLEGKLNLDPYSAATVFALNRFEASEEIKDRLDKGTNVVLDRYVYSNIAYQAARFPHQSSLKKEEFRAWARNLEFERLGLPRPDLVIVLSCSPQVGQERMANRDKLDKHEKDYLYQEAVANEYDYLSKGEAPMRWCWVDTDNLTPEQVMQSYLPSVKEILAKDWQV